MIISITTPIYGLAERASLLLATPAAIPLKNIDHYFVVRVHGQYPFVCTKEVRLLHRLTISPHLREATSQ